MTDKINGNMQNRPFDVHQKQNINNTSKDQSDEFNKLFHDKIDLNQDQKANSSNYEPSLRIPPGQLKKLNLFSNKLFNQFGDKGQHLGNLIKSLSLGGQSGQTANKIMNSIENFLKHDSSNDNFIDKLITNLEDSNLFKTNIEKFGDVFNTLPENLKEGFLGAGESLFDAHKAVLPTPEVSDLDPVQSIPQDFQVKINFNFDLFYQQTNEVFTRYGESSTGSYFQRIEKFTEVFKASFKLEIETIGDFMNISDDLSKVSPALFEDFTDALANLSDLSEESLSAFVDATGKMIDHVKSLYDHETIDLELDNIKDNIINTASTFFENVNQAKSFGAKDNELLPLFNAQPGTSQHLNLLGNIFASRGLFGQAEKAFQDAVLADPNNFKAFNNLGAVLVKQGDLDKAEDAFLKAIELNPEFGEAFSNYGVMLMKDGRFDEAIENHLKALEIAPDNYAFNYNLGRVYEEKGDLDKAQEYFEKALALNPNSSKVLSHLGQIYAENGEVDQAKDLLKRALELDPSDHEALAAYQKLGGDNEEREEAFLRLRYESFIKFVDELTEYKEELASRKAKQLNEDEQTYTEKARERFSFFKEESHVSIAIRASRSIPEDIRSNFIEHAKAIFEGQQDEMNALKHFSNADHFGKLDQLTGKNLSIKYFDKAKDTKNNKELSEFSNAVFENIKDVQNRGQVISELAKTNEHHDFIESFNRSK